MVRQGPGDVVGTPRLPLRVVKEIHQMNWRTVGRAAPPSGTTAPTTSACAAWQAISAGSPVPRNGLPALAIGRPAHRELIGGHFCGGREPVQCTATDSGPAPGS